MLPFQTCFAWSVVAVCCFSTSAYAAERIEVASDNAALLQSFVAPKGLALARGTIDLKEISRSVDNKEVLHLQYQETYSGYPIMGANPTLEVSNDHYTVHGHVYQGLKADLNDAPPYIFKEIQAKKAFIHVASTFQKQTHHQYDIINPRTELVVYLDKQQKAHWAYRVNFSAGSMKIKHSQEHSMIIDAVSFDEYTPTTL